MIRRRRFIEEDHRQHDCKRRHQVHEQPGTGRADFGDAAIPQDVTEEGGEDAGIDNAGDRSRAGDHMAAPGHFPEIERKQEQQPGKADRGEEGQRMHRRPARQQQGVGRPGHHRGQDPEVADIQRQIEQAPHFAAGDDGQHAGQ